MVVTVYCDSLYFAHCLNAFALFNIMLKIKCSFQNRINQRNNILLVYEKPGSCSPSVQVIKECNGKIPHPQCPLLRSTRAVTLHEARRVRGTDLRHVQTQQTGQNQLVFLIISPFLQNNNTQVTITKHLHNRNDTNHKTESMRFR